MIPYLQNQFFLAATSEITKQNTFKIGGVPKERCDKYFKWSNSHKVVGLASESESVKSLARLKTIQNIRKDINRCVHEEIQRPCEVMQTGEDRGLCGVEVHVPDRQSEQIISKAMNPFEVTSKTRWRSKEINKIFLHDYKTDREIENARRLY